MSSFLSGYKKLLVALVGVAAVFLVPFLNAKFGAGLSVSTVAGVLAGLVSIVFAYIAAEFKLDVLRASGPVSPVVVAVLAGLVQYAPEDKRADLSKLLADLSA